MSNICPVCQKVVNAQDSQSCRGGVVWHYACSKAKDRIEELEAKFAANHATIKKLRDALDELSPARRRFENRG